MPEKCKKERRRKKKEWNSIKRIRQRNWTKTKIKEWKKEKERVKTNEWRKERKLNLERKKNKKEKNK